MMIFIEIDTLGMNFYLFHMIIDFIFTIFKNKQID